MGKNKSVKILRYRESFVSLDCRLGGGIETLGKDEPDKA